jgi:hypothetical protein
VDATELFLAIHRCYSRWTIVGIFSDDNLHIGRSQPKNAAGIWSESA